MINVSRWFVSVLVWVVLVVGGAVAQDGTRGLTPIPFNDETPAVLSVSLDQKEPRIGSMVSICFQSSKGGYATLWNVSTANQVARVFPNGYSNVGQAAQIDGQRRYCAGAGGDPFRFRVDGPAGTEDLYLLWTTRPELQPNATAYRDAQAFAQDLQRLGAARPAEWGSTKTTYDIVPPQGPPPVVVPQPPVSGTVVPPVSQTPAPNPAQGATDDGPKVWILSLGANVGKLTKSNQDAEMFTQAMMKLFDVPDANVRLLANGKRVDFVAGMDWLARMAQPRDFVFVYFSGHGGRFKSSTSSDGLDEFLVPYDFETPNTDDSKYLFSQHLAVMINKLQTRKVVAVIDACHSAGVFRALEGDVLGARQKFWRLPEGTTDEAMEAGLEANLPRTRAAGGRSRVKANGLLLAAARRDQYALEGSKGSLFTLALVQEMTSQEGGTLDDVFARSVRLTEQWSKNKQDPEAVGDFELGRNVTFFKP